ncbi:MAG: hypothetical protein A2004_02260 [Spirochaetes bacterium GWC1_61_12]|nr:MAG: hypothetical protein A2004_02260 [Spirochaetes bacterium GWC1_61_12]OHD59208.1 MAG: hypothetical protein A2Y32_00290 [Spirochaetes bacterium GWF1_60_12]
MAQAAYQFGFASLGFSSHAPLPFFAEWNMTTQRLPDYLASIKRLADDYRGRMEILCGLEIDFIEHCWGVDQPLFRQLQLDYRLLAIHYIYHPDLPPEQYVAVDMADDQLDAYIARCYGGKPRRLVEKYYQAVTAGVEAGGFDILAHLDLIKKNNRGGRLFDEGSAWYRRAAMTAVEALAGSGIIVEINTGGLARGKTDTVYPAPWILAELQQRDVQICINADAHRPEHLTLHRAAGLEAAAAAGYRELEIPGPSGRRSIPLA